MELGIRNDLVDPDTGTPHEENEEEEELAQDPEIPPDDPSGSNGGAGGDDHSSNPSGDGYEPEEEVNPRKDVGSSKPCGTLGGALVGNQNEGVDGMMVNAVIHGNEALMEDDIGLHYDPFDRPPGEIVEFADCILSASLCDSFWSLHLFVLHFMVYSPTFTIKIN